MEIRDPEIVYNVYVCICGNCTTTTTTACMHYHHIYTHIDRYREVGRRKVNTYQRVVVVV